MTMTRARVMTSVVEKHPNAMHHLWIHWGKLDTNCLKFQEGVLLLNLKCWKPLWIHALTSYSETTAKNCNHATNDEHFTFAVLTVPVQSELMPLMEKCSIPQKILVQRQFKLLIGLINSLINYQRTKRSCKKIFQAVQSKKYIWSSWPEDDKSQKSRDPSTDIACAPG